MINLESKEIAMLRLAFDPGSPEGEHRNATDKLIASLRGRGITADQFLSNGGNGSKFGGSFSSSTADWERLYRHAQGQVSGLRTENLSLMKDKRSLEQKVTELSSRRAAQAANPNPSPNRPASSSSFSGHSYAYLSQPVSQFMSFHFRDAKCYTATDRDGVQWAIGKTSSGIYLGRKTRSGSRFHTVKFGFASVAEAVTELESRCAH